MPEPTLEDAVVGYIRSACLRGFEAEVSARGGNAERFALAAGLPLEALHSDEVLITESCVATVLEFAARALSCPDLGLRIAARQDITMLGSLALAIQHSATLGDALECTNRYLFVHSRSVSITLADDPLGERGIAALEYRPASALGPVQAIDCGLGFLHRTLTYLVGHSYGLRSVILPYSPAAPISAHRDFFQATVRVDAAAPAAVLRMPRQLMKHSIGQANDELRQSALAFLAGQAGQTPEGASSLAPRVRSAVQQSLGMGEVATASVAAMLAMHPRTIQRRLEAEGTTFGAIVDEVRKVTAHRLLTTTDLPISQIAGMLGFAEQSALSRAARRWWDTTPRAMRHSLATGDVQNVHSVHDS